MTEVLCLLNTFKDSYIGGNIIPSLQTPFELQLFNTFRSYIDIDQINPVSIVQHTDERGFFSEFIRTEMGGNFLIPLLCQESRGVITFIPEK